MGGRFLFKEGRMPKSTNGRVRRSLAEWRTLCERFARSGLNVAEFCRKRSTGGVIDAGDRGRNGGD